MPPDDKRMPQLGPNTLVPVGALVAICGVLIGFTSWMGERFNSIESQLKVMSIERETANAVMMSHWTKTEQELWAERLKSGNPALIVPEVR